jgi:hypothetical protein
MRFSILEIFVVFWLSAFLWVMIEYFYQRLAKKTPKEPDSKSYQKDNNQDSFAA